MTEWVWSGLDPAQARGAACVVCGSGLRAAAGRDYRRWVPVGAVVGRSPDGPWVLACAGACAARAGELAVVAAVPGEALLAAGAAFLSALDTAGGDVRTAYPDDLVIAAVVAAAPLVVAAELRRLAGLLEADTGLLRRRADHLDPAGGGVT